MELPSLNMRELEDSGSGPYRLSAIADRFFDNWVSNAELLDTHEIGLGSFEQGQERIEFFLNEEGWWLSMDEQYWDRFLDQYQAGGKLVYILGHYQHIFTLRLMGTVYFLPLAQLSISDFKILPINASETINEIQEEVKAFFTWICTKKGEADAKK